MNYTQEQSNELEALSEIYYDAIKVISDKPPLSFSITVRPQASNFEQSYAENDEDDDDDDDDYDGDSDNSDDESYTPQEQNVELRFTIPSKYPDEMPTIEIVDSSEIDEDDLDELLETLKLKAEELKGTVMVFSLVNDAVEFLLNKSELLEEEEESFEQKKLAAEEEARVEGTPVTEQAFLEWRVKFENEMRSKESETSAKTGLTGRAMFEFDRALAESDLNFIEDLDQEQVDKLLDNIEDLVLDDVETE